MTELSYINGTIVPHNPFQNKWSSNADVGTPRVSSFDSDMIIC